MATLKLKVGDRVVSCYEWSDLDQRLEMSKKYPDMHPGQWSRNGRTGTIRKLQRNAFGRIHSVAVEWDLDYNNRGRWVMGYDPGYNPRMEGLTLSMAIRYLHPIGHCNTCKHRLVRLGEGDCKERKYEMNHKAFVNKWRQKLTEKKNDKEA